MSDSYINSLPSHEQEKIRKRMRSEADYERLRNNVKGPEDLEKELRRSEQLAELQFDLETNPQLSNALKSAVEKDVAEQGIEHVFEGIDRASPEAKMSVEQGKFDMRVDAHPHTKQDTLVALPEGNVQEKLPVKPAFSNRYVSQFTGQGTPAPLHGDEQQAEQAHEQKKPPHRRAA